jgi:hypothetical protein
VIQLFILIFDSISSKFQVANVRDASPDIVTGDTLNGNALCVFLIWEAISIVIVVGEAGRRVGAWSAVRKS